MSIFRMIRTLNNARYIVGFGFKTKENDSQILFVYDVIKHCVVREKSLVSVLYSKTSLFKPPLGLNKSGVFSRVFLIFE